MWRRAVRQGGISFPRRGLTRPETLEFAGTNCRDLQTNAQLSERLGASISYCTIRLGCATLITRLRGWWLTRRHLYLCTLYVHYVQLAR
jgi:hypothetical protein